MNVLIESGSAKVLVAGSIISFDGGPVTMHLNDIDGTNENFTVRILFATDADDKTFRAEKVDIGSDGFGIRVVNYDNTLGQGVVDPIDIAHNSAGDRLYLCFMIYSFTGKANKKISYTVYERKGGRGA